MGKREGMKIILRIAAAALAVACIWAVTDKLFSAANETERIWNGSRFYRQEASAKIKTDNLCRPPCGILK